uniref:Inter-alpha-trypsin inhibitor heavy chain 3b, tandem duplicate 2 n=1 Tax=Amphiprion percula TaxID=161767 RepID=A0A3P8TA20_AMPPE
MERTVLQLTLFGLLLALATTLPNKDDWDIYSFHINSTVTDRYATTVITSRVANRMDESKEIEFHVRIPKNAFISKFRMFIDGQAYDGIVKAKEQAQKQYTDAVSRGQSAGIVSSVGRTLEEFKTSVTVAAHQKVTFELTYEELMKRTLGKYELQIHARPMQPVKDFKVDVYIHEKAGISFINVKGGLSTKALANAITKTHADKQAWVHFYPTEDQQKTCDSCGVDGMNGDLVVVYDVNRDTSLGDIKKSDGYFVHHFAPAGLSRIPKNVVFLIDQSGSMHGRKIEQTRIALIHILNDLAEDDYFGLITFDGDIIHWKRELVQASSGNVESAKSFAQTIRDRGATDINQAVLKGASMLNAHPSEGSASILILLTDGDPTSGETNIEVIQSNVRRAIADKFPLYCLGFGFDVNFNFLEKMSLQNNGVARRIYEDSDADLQLKGFYEEIVVAGQITDNDVETFAPQVVAISGRRRVTFSGTNTSVESTGTESGGHIQRVWAYLTVKQLLEKELQLSGPEKEKVKKDALELSLKYSFVTPLTSMVVTKPPGENTDVLHKPKEGEAPGRQANTRIRQHSFPFHSPPSHRGFAGMMPKGGAGYHMISGGMAGPPVGAGGGAGYPLAAMPVPAFDMEDFDDAFYAAAPIGRADSIPRRPKLQKRPGNRPRPTFVAAATTPAPLLHRFLLKTDSASPPLCFDVNGAALLKLLHHPSRELYVNGELDSVTNGGFKKIVIHFTADQHVEVTTTGVTVRLGQNVTHHTGQDPITVGSMTVIRRDKEIDVAAADARLIILVHQKNGKEFLWPVLRQKPSATNMEGILALTPAVYEEVQQASLTNLKIKDQEISATSATAVDYGVVFPLTMNCWLMSAESALQRRLDDFFVAQL